MSEAESTEMKAGALEALTQVSQTLKHLVNKVGGAKRKLRKRRSRKRRRSSKKGRKSKSSRRRKSKHRRKSRKKKSKRRRRR